MTDTTPTADELRAEAQRLTKAANAAAAAERDARRNADQPVYRFDLVPVAPRGDGFDWIGDPTCRKFRLSRTCVNVDAATAAGWSTHETAGGSHAYLFNDGTGRFIGPGAGGGHLWASEPETWDALSAYVVAHPDGGDVTEIIVRVEQPLRAVRRRW